MKTTFEGKSVPTTGKKSLSLPQNNKHLKPNCMLRKILHPFYVLYQVLFAWWIALIVVAITAILISLLGHHLKIKNGDHTPAVIWCKLTCWIFLIPVKVVD